jgi:hypothetical protein
VEPLRLRDESGPVAAALVAPLERLERRRRREHDEAQGELAVELPLGHELDRVPR